MYDHEYWHEPLGHGRTRADATGYGPDTASVLAENTPSVELTSRAEKPTERPEALEPGTYGEARYRREMPPQSKAGCEVETLVREGKHVHEPPPEALSRRRERA